MYESDNKINNGLFWSLIDVALSFKSISRSILAYNVSIRAFLFSFFLLKNLKTIDSVMMFLFCKHSFIANVVFGLQSKYAGCYVS